jgi:pyruvate kinase
MKSGVYGVQMSEETAVGQYVAECVELLNRMDQEVMTEKIQM